MPGGRGAVAAGGVDLNERVEWVPGLIVSDPLIQAGEPCIEGTRISVNAAHMVYAEPWAYTDADGHELAHLKALALYAFSQGAAWQRQKRRRKT